MPLGPCTIDTRQGNSISIDILPIDSSEPYYIRLENGNGLFGLGTDYKVDVHPTTGPASIVRIDGELLIKGDPDNRPIPTCAVLDISDGTQIRNICQGYFFTVLLTQPNPYTLTVSADGYLESQQEVLVSPGSDRIHVVFELEPIVSDEDHDILVTAENGSVKNVKNPYPPGSEAILVPVPEAHHQFSHWEGDGISIENREMDPLFLTVSDDMEITSKFRSLLYRLTFQNSDNCVECGMPLPPPTEYNPGETVHWSVNSSWPGEDGIGGERHVADISSGSIVMNADQLITLDWDQQFYLNITKKGHGLITHESSWRSKGDVIEFTAQDTEIFLFERWEGDYTTNAEDATQVITMNQPHELTAVFRLDPNLNQTPFSMEFQKGWNLISIPAFSDYMEIEDKILATSAREFLDVDGWTIPCG